MDPRVRRLFHELAGLARADRERIFNENEVPEPVRAEVESLLDFDASATHRLTGSVLQVAEQALAPEKIGGPGYCGPYRLVRLIGKGGMGAVYLGERTDGEIRQEVAVKLLRLDADRPSWRRRFLRERQLLADLSHPSIARLLDAGHNDEDQPYLVMEYVEGVPIDAYAANLHLRDQLKLFLRVCEGVAHAHRHLIIHRDLKPSNILVDSSGQPKLLDFGIAKVLNDNEDATQTVERLLTPYYASPEQFYGKTQTTATDIYSLGAVLYKLLTGQSPHETGGETSQAIEVIAGTREIPQPSRLNAALPQDIDFILRQALRREPEQRYSSVEAFAADIQAFLERRPVAARSGDAWYRARRFLHRHWLPLAAGLVVLVSLAVGFGVANHERSIAQRRFNDVRQLSNKLFEIDRQVRNLPGGTATRQLIVDTSLEYLRRLSADVQGDPDLALDLGTAYMRVGRVQGVPISANLGQIEDAEKNLRIAESLIASVLSSQPANRTALLRMAQITHDRMVLAQARRPDTEALPLAHSSKNWLEKYLSTGKVEEAEKEQVVIVGMNVANWYTRKDLIEEGLELLRRTIDIAKQTGQPSQAGAAQIVMARTLRQNGDLEGALAAIREGESLLKPAAVETARGSRVSYRLAVLTRGEILGAENGLSAGRIEEAAECFEYVYRLAAEDVRRDAHDADSRFAVSYAALRLAGAIRSTHPRRALALYDESIRRSAEIKNHPRARRGEIRALSASTYVLRKLGQSAEAGRRLNAAFELLRQLKLFPAQQVELGSEADDTVRAQAEHEAGTGDVRRGAGTYQKLLDLVSASKSQPETNLADAADLSNIYEALAKLHRLSGQTELASTLEARRSQLWRHWDRKLPNNAFVRRQLGVVQKR